MRENLFPLLFSLCVFVFFFPLHDSCKLFRFGTSVPLKYSFVKLISSSKKNDLRTARLNPFSLTRLALFFFVEGRAYAKPVDYTALSGDWICAAPSNNNGTQKSNTRGP